MAYNNKAKLKTLYLQRILEEETDAEHGLSMRQLIERLDGYGIKAERKSVYRDLDALREAGADIRTYQRNPVEYALVKRALNFDDIMLLVDAVQSCRSLTERQARLLTTNLKLFASDHQRALLDRSIHVSGRARTAKESVFGSIHLIHEALRTGRKLSFVYYRRGTDGVRRPTRDGAARVVSPVQVSFSEGFYYLAAVEEASGPVRQYRIDRMGKVAIADEAAAVDREVVRSWEQLGDYERFGQFAGPAAGVTLAVRSDKVELVTDRFGEAAAFSPLDNGHARALVHVRVSPQFFGWVAGMEGLVRIVGPESVRRQYRDYLEGLLEQL